MKPKKMRKLQNIATEKQIRMLSFIEEKCEVKFEGETRQEVYDFIGEWYSKAIQMANIEQAMGNICVPVYKAKKTYHGNDVHGQWEETLNLRDTIAHERFKGELLRGKNPAEALLDFQRRAYAESLLREQQDYDDYDFELD